MAHMEAIDMPETDLIERLNKRAENGRVFHTDRKLFAEAATALSENIETINGQAMDLATLRAELEAVKAAFDKRGDAIVEASDRAARLDSMLREARYFIYAPAEDLKDGVLSRIDAALTGREG